MHNRKEKMTVNVDLEDGHQFSFTIEDEHLTDTDLQMLINVSNTVYKNRGSKYTGKSDIIFVDKEKNKKDIYD